jgi:hypothetical protein
MRIKAGRRRVLSLSSAGLALLLALTFAVTPRTHADVTEINGFCFSGPGNTLVSCSSPTPTPAPPQPEKFIQLGGPVAGPKGTTSYSLTVTSRLACFALTEPVDIFAMGAAGSAALEPIFPPQPISQAQHARVFVDQHVGTATSGTASLTLEVFNALAGTTGINVKAVWPDESREQLLSVIAPPTPTVTPTGVPAGTATPTTTAAPSPSSTSSTPAPSPTVTPTATPPTLGFFVQSCVDPLYLNGHTLGGDFATLYGRTTPGSFCTPFVEYSDGGGPSDTVYEAEASSGAIAGESGIVQFPWTVDTYADSGVAAVTCTSPDGLRTHTAYSYFFVSQHYPPGPTATNQCQPDTPGAGPQAGATVSNTAPTIGNSVIVYGCMFENGIGIAGVPVTMNIRYFNRFGFDVQSCAATTDTNGFARCDINVTSPPAAPGEPALVQEVYTYQGTTYYSVTAFTPDGQITN